MRDGMGTGPVGKIQYQLRPPGIAKNFDVVAPIIPHDHTVFKRPIFRPQRCALREKVVVINRWDTELSPHSFCLSTNSQKTREENLQLRAFCRLEGPDKSMSPT